MLAQVWSSPRVQYYAGQLAEGRQLPAAVAGGEDDPLQMGGDFTFRCSDDVLILAHPSKNPKDRPEICRILDFDKNI